MTSLIARAVDKPTAYFLDGLGEAEAMLDEQIKDEQITKPPTRWRNWWRSLADDTWDNLSTGPRAGPTVFSSKDAAETKAALGPYWETQPGFHHPLVEYLGAFPEGERP